MDIKTVRGLIEQALLDLPNDLPFRGEEGYYTYVPYYHLFYLLVKHKLAQRPEPERVVCVECGVEGGRGIASFAAASPRADVYGYDIRFHGMELCKVLTTYPNITFFQRSSIPAQLHELPPIDILHLDSHHSYEHVRHEFKSYSPGMAPGGIIMIDDLVQGGGNTEVERAFDEISWVKFKDARVHPGSGYGIILAP